MQAVIRAAVVVCLLLSLGQCQRRAAPTREVVPMLLRSPIADPAPVPPRPGGAALPPRLRLASHAPGAPPPPLVRAAADRLLFEAPPQSPHSAKATAAPVSLTASDGTGLKLVRLTASVVVQGPLAFTELQLTFSNPEPRQLEGRFLVVLPKGAAISRFAMLLPSGWQEAEVVERTAARRAYEDFLHRRQDPALLEHEAGNQFSARVFPIPPSGTKELKISYSQELLAAADLYRLPLVGLPELGELLITAIAGDQVAQVVKRNFVPERDFLIRPPSNLAGRALGLRSEELMVARVQLGRAQEPGKPVASAALPSLRILFDTSASRALGFAARVSELGQLLKSLAGTYGRALPVDIVCFDQTVERIYQGPVAGFGEKEQERILRREPLGASDLQAALSFAKGQKAAARLVVLGDGVVTAGASDNELGEAVSQLKHAGVQRLDVVLSGGIRDEAAMARLVSGHLPSDGMVIDGSQGTAAVLHRLGRATLSGVQVAVPGARWVWPARLDGVQPGDEFLVYAEFSETSPAPTQRATVTLSGPLTQQTWVPLYPVTRPLLERALVRAYLTSLGQELSALDAKAATSAGGPGATLRRDIVSLSRRFRVLSDYTALLVLETEADYARFGIDRQALADILTVGEHGIELSQRRAPVVSNHGSPGEQQQDDRAQPDRPAAAFDEAAGSDQAKRAGVRGILGSMEPSGSSQTAGSGRDRALGRDSKDELGGLVGMEIGEDFSWGGFGKGPVGLGGTMYRISPAPLESSSEDAVSPRSFQRRHPAVPEVVPGTVAVRGALDGGIIQRVIHRHLDEVKFCYQRELARDPSLQGPVTSQFGIGLDGRVSASIIQSSGVRSPPIEQCIQDAVRRWGFPRPASGTVIVTCRFMLQIKGVPPPPERVIRPHWWGKRFVWQRPDFAAQSNSAPAYSGKLAEVMTLLQKRQVAPALALASKWRSEEPGDLLALIALGEALEAHGEVPQAARAYGSIIDLFPSRADLRRFAGERLERLGSPALPLAADTYARALGQRPDHPASHRLRALVLLRQGDPEAAFAGLEVAVRRQYPADRFAGVDRILREDLGLVGAAWVQKVPARRSEIQARLAQLGAALEREPSLRFVLNWETDANDVDFHIHDGSGGHAFYDHPTLSSGGKLYADVTTGYGPECFTIPGKATAFPYKLEAHYYSRGPMGYGMGKLEIIQHDGNGNLKFVERPFLVMNDQAYVDLGVLTAPL